VYSSPRLSFDDKSVAVAIVGPAMTEPDIWTVDVARDNPSRLTSDPAADWFPAWSPNAADIYFGSSRVRITTPFHKIGVGEEIALEKAPYLYATMPNDVSHDGRLLAYQASTTKGYDLGVMTLDNGRKQSFLESPFNEVQARFAPSQRFIAYASDESGQFEIYVRRFPPSSSGEWKVSLAGGMQPEWRRDGKELFFIGLDQRMMAVAVTSEKEFQAGTPRPLFDVETPEAAAPYPTHYAVAGDGQRFLVNTVVDQPDRAAFTVIVNWTEMLKKSR
jgi:Tol biopolymer transport system component